MSDSKSKKYKKISSSNAKGKHWKLSDENKKNIGDGHKGAKNAKWKGVAVGYRAIHSWIVRSYGQPTTCEHCQTGNLIGRKIHWATKTLPYVRNRENWLRLCVKCHHLYDSVNNLRNKKL